MHTHVWSRGAIQTAPICSAPACLEQGKAAPLAARRWKSSARPTHRASARLSPDRPRAKQFPVRRCCWGSGGGTGLCPHAGRPRGSAPLRPSGSGCSAPHGAVRSRAERRAWAGRHCPPGALGTAGRTEPGSSLPPAVRRVPSALLHNGRQRRGYTTNGGAAPARIRYRRERGEGAPLEPLRRACAAAMSAPSRGHLRYLRRVRHPGAAGEQLPFPSLPASLLPCPRPLTAPHHRGAGCRRRAPSQPVPSLRSFSLRFFFFPSLSSPVFTPPTWK